MIKKLYYEPDDMAKVGKVGHTARFFTEIFDTEFLKPLVDIDIQSEITAADEALLVGGSGKQAEKGTPKQEKEEQSKDDGLEVGRNDTKAAIGDTPPSIPSQSLPAEPSKDQPKTLRQPGKHATLATPAVRHLTKELKLNIADIEGTGKDGRVTKEDVQKHADAQKETDTAPPAPGTAPVAQATDHVRQLTPVQSGMFKQMTRSLSIPHFLYTDNVDFTTLNSLRKKLNASKEKSQKLSALPFIVKAVSLSLQSYPLLNSHLDATTNPDKPQMLVKGQHNIGIAIDSPSGLLVPVVKNVQSHSIESLAGEISRLSNLARTGKLNTADLSGATFTLSNIGSIGGTAVAPVIVSPQVAILGVGRARTVPAFDKNGELIRKEECVFSWSADHRVIDGAMAARCAESVRQLLENIEDILIRLK